MVDYSIFNHVPEPPTDDPQRLFSPQGMDFGLRPGAAAIDAGTVIPNITDGYTGSAPDLGALEAGVPVPHYGPRP